MSSHTESSDRMKLSVDDNIYIYIYIYIYIVTVLAVTNSLCEFVANQRSQTNFHGIIYI